MKHRWHTSLAGIWGLALCGWLASGLAVQAASRDREGREWDTAASNLLLKQWATAAEKFAEFTNNYRDSERFARAVLNEAEAQFHLAEAREMNNAAKRPWEFKDVVDLLQGQLYRAGSLADQYVYRIAGAHYADGNFLAAADAYARLARDYDTMRTEALFREADCYYQAKDYARVVEKLAAPDGAFQQLAKTNVSDEWLARGIFLLAETDLSLTNYTGAAAALREMPVQAPGSDVEWKRQYLTARASLEAGQIAEALQNSTNLLAAAAGKPAWTTASRMVLAELDRRAGQMPEAISNYQAVLDTETNLDIQREALLNMVDLKMQGNKIEESARDLDQFVKKYPDEHGSDLFFLLQGELQLRQYFDTNGQAPAVAGGGYLLMAETNLQVVAQNTNSEHRGRAFLNLGWCWWTEGRLPESGQAFTSAASLLTNGEDRAEALFKLGDVQFKQKDFDGAIRSYSSVINQGAGFASASNSLFERALYQTVRASTQKEPPDLAVASNAVDRILKWFPESLLGEQGTLLLGQTTGREGNAAEARSILDGFIAKWPDSLLRPEVELAIARTYEHEKDWSNAVAQYSKWIETYPANASRPSAEYSRALAKFQFGDEAGAFTDFTNFVAAYPTNELTARAENWIGRYYFNQQRWSDAETSFQNAYKSPRGTSLKFVFEAERMAGLSAYRRQGYGDAEKYFQELAGDTNYPAAWRTLAQFALADSLRESLALSPTNLEPVRAAVDILSDIAANPANAEIAAEVWGDLAGCYLLLTNYSAATNAYARVIADTNADLGLRCTAENGFASALAGMARLKPPGSAENHRLLQDAIDHYLNVVTGANLGENERLDLGFFERSGKEAGQLMEETGDLPHALALYEMMRNKLELQSQRAWLEARIDSVKKRLGSPRQ